MCHLAMEADRIEQFAPSGMLGAEAWASFKVTHIGESSNLHCVSLYIIKNLLYWKKPKFGRFFGDSF